MSSDTGSKNPTSSSALTKTQSSTKKVVIGKKPIIIEMDGTVVGEFASNFSTRTEDIIKTIVPVHYKDWRQVPQNFRNDVWKNLMAEFELDIPPEDKVKEAKAKRKSGEVSGSTTENDELSEVFGKDPRGRVRGAGSHVTKKQMIHLGIAKAKEKANKVDKEGINALKDEFKSYVQEAVKVQNVTSVNFLERKCDVAVDVAFFLTWLLS
ncbi:hypothetical protein LguiB_018017 [Lonicera macranthoides]